jgi:hypothetical protein
MAGCEDLENELEGVRKEDANFGFKHAHSGALCGVAVLKASLKRPRERDKKKPLSLRKHGRILRLSFQRCQSLQRQGPVWSRVLFGCGFIQKLTVRKSKLTGRMNY